MIFLSFDLITYTNLKVCDEPYKYYNEKYIDSETFEKICITKVYPKYSEYDNAKVYIDIKEKNDEEIYANISACLISDIHYTDGLPSILKLVSKVNRHLKINSILE